MKQILTFISGHRVKIVGGAMAVLGFIQGYPGLKSLLAPNEYAWFMFFLGILTVWFGSLKTSLSSGVLNNYKTMILGAFTAALAFIQGYPGLSGLLTPNAYAWASFVLGLVLVVFGLMNTLQASAAPAATPTPPTT